MKKNNLLTFIISLCVYQVTFCQIGIINSPPLVADTLAQRIAGQGVEVFNVSKTCPDNASGYFFGGSSAGFSISQGILLTTGSTAVAFSPNTVGSATSSNGGGGYSPLEEFPIAYNGTFDACVLEFDFIPFGTEISLNYVFGSEEYPEYVGSQFNDILAILIQGGSEYPSNLPVTERNIATIPDSPNVHVGINFLNFGAYNQFYIDNVGNQFIQYDGLTTTLSANAVVTPCQIYHLTLAIADVSDAIYDSGIFIEENSFQSNFPNLEVDLSNDSENEMAENCGEISLEFLPVSTVQEIPVVTSTDQSSNTYQLLLEGTATLGEDYTISTANILLGTDISSTLIITPIMDGIEEAEETIIISLFTDCNNSYYSFTETIYLRDALVLTSTTDVSLCQSDLTIQLSSNGAENYNWTPSTGLSCTDCPNPTAFVQGDITYNLFAETAGCIEQSSIEITIDEDFENASISLPQTICNTEVFELSATGGLTYQWESIPEDGLDFLSCTNCPNPVFQPLENTEGLYEYEVNISSASNCNHTLFTSMNITSSDVEVSEQNLIVCEGESTTITATGTGTFIWTNSSGSELSTTEELTVTPDSTSVYTLTVLGGNCPNLQKTIHIEVDELQATYSSSEDFVCEGSEIILTATSGNEHQWLDMEGNLLSNETEFHVFPTSNTNYQLVLSNENCTDTTTATIAVEPIREIEFITPSPRICGDLTSVDIAIQPITGVTFEWEPAEYFSMSSEDGSVITATPPNNEISFTYTVTPITALGCSPSASIDVVVSEELEITVDAPEVLCVDFSNPQPFTIQAFGADVYTWAPFGPIIPVSAGSNEAILIPNPANNDVIITVYGEAANGECVGEHSFQIQVFQEPEIVVNAPSICTGESGEISVDIEGGSGSFEYEWIPTNGLSNPNSPITQVNLEESTVYTLIVADLMQGCEVLKEVFVEVNNPIEASITPSTSICEGEELTLSVTSMQDDLLVFWSDDTGGVSVGIEGTEITVSPTTTTTYYAGLFGPNGFCHTELSTTVEVSSLNLQINASETVVCRGETVELTATGAASFEWLQVSGINNSSNPFQLLAPTETTTYVVTGYSANGQCLESTEITIEVGSVDVLTPLSAQICGGGESVALAVYGGEMATYNWSPAIGLSNTDATVVLASPSETTLYSLQVITAEGCEENINFLVEVFEDPNITISPSNVQVCKNESETFTLSGGMEYTFTANENQNFSLQYLTSNTVEITALTDLDLVIEGIDENGCLGTTEAKIEVTSPILELSENVNICQGESVQLFADGGEGASYFWSPAASLSDPTVSNPIATPTELTAYTVAVMNSMSCSDVATIFIGVSPLVEGELIAESGNQFCVGTSTVLSVLNSGNNFYTYDWYDASGALITSNDSGSLTVTPSNSTTYSVVITNLDGCQKTEEIALILDQPVIEAQDMTTCIGASAVLSASGAGAGGTYEWQPANLIECLTGDCSVVSVSPFEEETSVTFNIVGTTLEGCVGNSEASLSVSQALNLTINVENPSVCVGESLQINAGGASDFTWQGEGLNTTSGSSVNLTLEDAGEYTYTLNGMAGGCEADLTFTVTANDVPEITTEDVSICNGENALLEASGSNGLVYKWFDEENNEITNLTVSPTETTTYTVEGTDDNGCKATTTITVEVSTIDVELSADVMAICEGESVSLSAIGENILVYLWTTGEITAELVVSPMETTTYGVVVANAQGCSANKEITIEVNPNPSIELTNSYLACANEALLIEAEIDLENTSLQWTPSTGIDNPTTAKPIISASETTTYVLTATSDFGCETIAETTIDITNDCVFPGDADNNGEVNMFDLFPMGANFGVNELARNSISNEWQGFGVMDWSTTQSNGQNLKYVDCNGNGSIGFEDTTGIIQNFDLFQKSKGFVKGGLADPELRFESNTNLIGVGETLEIQVWLGSAENPAIDLYAIAFETTFDTNLIDPNSISMDFSGSDLGTHNVDLLAVNLVNAETGRVNVSMSRTASPGANGEVYLLTIRMRTLESLESPNDLTFNISDFGATNSNEETILANTDELPTITIDPDIVDIEAFSPLAKPYTLYPTFTQEGFQLNYTLQKSPDIEVNLFDLSGQKIGLLLKGNQPLGNHQEEIDLTKWSLAAGVYIVELQLDRKVYREKIVVF